MDKLVNMIEDITDASGQFNGKIRYFPVNWNGYGKKYKNLKSVTRMGTAIYYNKKFKNWVAFAFDNENNDKLLWTSGYDSDLYERLLHDGDNLELLPFIFKWAHNFRVNLMYDDIITNNAKLKELEESLGFVFKDKRLLQTALIHKSFAEENQFHIKQLNLKGMNNKRLETFGDGVLDLIIAEYAYINYNSFNQGYLTKFKSFLVNNKRASKIGVVEFGLDDYLLKGKGENKNVNVNAINRRVADTLEAIIGAVFLDQGYEKAKEFVLKHCVNSIIEYLSSDADTVREIIDDSDPISKFNNAYQKIYGKDPVFSEIPNTSSNFSSRVYIEDDFYAEGEGESKSLARKEASINGLKCLKELNHIT